MTLKRNALCKSIGLLFIASCFSGCSNPFSEIQLTGNRESVKADTLALVPIGTSIADAEQLMTSDGFSCVYKENLGISEAEEGKRFAEHEAMDYLHCTKTKNWMIACAVQWDLALKDEDRKVSDVYIGYHTSCL